MTPRPSRIFPARWLRAATVGMALLAAFHVASAAVVAPSDRLRVIVETDAGGDPDDEQSLVRFLLYANEWDVEGIIANRPQARDGENRNPNRTGLAIVQAQVRAYAQMQPSLARHDPRYPTGEHLMLKVVPGYDDTNAAVAMILAAVDSNDPRPVWYADWGSDRGAATNNLRRALDRVQRERGDAGYARFKARLRVVLHDRIQPEHATREPAWPLWVNTFEPEIDGRRWYHRFSAITSPAGGFDVVRDVLNGHGPLGALYPTNTTHWLKEGDTSTFLGWIPNGLGDPEHPEWGSWAGRYGRRPDHPGRAYFWANQADGWMGTTNRDNTLRRWASALQNDFRARLDWCVRTPTEANHPPTVALNGVDGTQPIQFHARPGATVRLDASGTADPDGQTVDYDWFVYPEAGTYRGVIALQTNDVVAEFRVPEDAAGTSVHVVLAVTDRGLPPLTRYRRAIVSVTDGSSAAREIAPFFQPPAELAGIRDQRRSPLERPDGSRVTTPDGWTARRAELKDQWMELMGPWPPVLREARLEVISEQRRDNVTQSRVRVPLAPEQSGEGWLLVPPGPGPFPAVLVVYYEPETSIGWNPRQTQRDFALQLARRGFVTLAIGTPGGDARKPDLGTATCQPLSFHAYVAANCWQALAHLPAVDASRIGVVGHSYGGKWALFAGALWDRFACVAVSDPGIVFDETRSNVNYWEPWYLGFDPKTTRRPGIPGPDNPRTGAYALMMAAGRDLHELHALIAPRPFLVSGGAEDPVDRWQALQHRLEVDRLLGVSNRLVFTTRPNHDPNETSNAQLYAFFEHFLLFNGRPGK